MIVSTQGLPNTTDLYIECAHAHMPPISDDQLLATKFSEHRCTVIDSVVDLLWKAVIPARSEIHMIPDVNPTPLRWLTLASSVIRDNRRISVAGGTGIVPRRGRGITAAEVLIP